MQLAGNAVTLTRDGRTLLSDITLQASSGEFIAVIGPNGAGKSTLLSTLAGLTKATRGSISLDGKPLSQYTPQALAKHRAYLPQSPRCDWPLPVHRLVGLGLTPTLPAWGDFSATDIARIDAAIAACDLSGQREQTVTTLSGGELARAMLARALVADPAVLIVDEPLSGLDPRHAQDAARRLQHLALKEGKLVIAAVHDLNIALRRATRVWALQGGCLVADGPPGEVITSNLLQQIFEVQAEVSGHGARAYVDFGGV
jgi:iron complex transport system ATP-binding protein